jgi:hypothetical protein
MARSSECTEQYAQKVFDRADIVRDAMFYQLAFTAHDGRFSETSQVLIEPYLAVHLNCNR